MFCSSRADRTSTNFKKFLSWKLDKFNLFIHSLVGWNLENLYKHAVPIFVRLSWHFKREKPFFWKASLLQNKNWLIVYKTSRLVRISLLISNVNKEFFFFLEKAILSKQWKTFSRVCIAWYKTLEGLGELLTVMQTRDEGKGLQNCLEFSHPSSVYIRLCKHRKKVFQLLEYCFF